MSLGHSSNMTEIQADRAARILKQLETPAESGKSRFVVKIDDKIKRIISDTLMNSEALTSEFITRIQYLCMDEAEAKEVRRLAGIEKRKGPVSEREVVCTRVAGLQYRRTREGMAAQKEFDQENGIDRPKGFYEYRHGLKGQFPRETIVHPKMNQL